MSFRFEPIVQLSETSSTNDVAASLPEGAVVVADRQTAGRGRRGRVWFSPAGSGLYASVVVAPGRAAQPARAAALLTLTAGVAISEGIEASSGLFVDLKWPNDLYVGRRKLGGILAEAATVGGPIDRVVLGFGINVGIAAYPPELADRATAIEAEVGRAVDRDAVLAESLGALARRYDELLAGAFDGILDAWRRRAPSAAGARVTWMHHAGPIDGITRGIDDEGALLIRAGARTERVIAGEIVWH